MSGKVRVRDIVRTVLEEFPASWAESWDAVGLRVGDPDAEVTGVALTLEATSDRIRWAASRGANVLATHHPPALGEHDTFTAAGSTGALFTAASEGVAVISAHTNLDRSPQGAPVLLRALGLEDGEPLESSEIEGALVTVWVPPSHADSVRAAMAEVGAGRVGEYTGCSFTVTGTGRFTPSEGASPLHGSPGEDASASEERIEMVAPLDLAGPVIEAARAAHPYEEPLIVFHQVRVSRGAARLGRVTDLEEATTLQALAEKVAATFDCSPRVWGDPSVTIRRLATTTGSGGSLISDAIFHEADALLLGEVRYHEALDALARGLVLVEAGHDVTEWPLVPVLAAAVSKTPGLDPESVMIDAPARAWWTL